MMCFLLTRESLWLQLLAGAEVAVGEEEREKGRVKGMEEGEGKEMRVVKLRDVMREMFLTFFYVF